MKKMIYFMVMAFVAVSFIACDDENDTDGADGSTDGTYLAEWSYEKPYFEFEYDADTIRLGSYAIASKDFKQMFLGMASEKMGEYFTGIEFKTTNQLLIKARKASGESLELHAGYVKNDQLLEVTLDKEDMKALMGEKAAMIPPISFNYFQTGKEMTIFFDKVYVRTLWETAQLKNMLSGLIAVNMIPGFSEMEATQQQKVLQGIQQQISGILNNIQVLKIGFVLTK